MRNPTLNLDWNPDLYQSQHSFVWEYGADLLALLAPQPGERILDLGCGTGQLTEQIAKTGATAIGIDKSPEMVTRAKENYPHLEFAIADATQLADSESFDAVFSNATLHWVTNAEAAVQGLQRALKPRGRLVVELGGKGNVATILTALQTAIAEAGYSTETARSPWYFPSIAEYATLLESYGFIVTAASLFDRPTPLAGGDRGMRDWLEMFAAHLLAVVPVEERDELIRTIESRLRPKLYLEGIWIADYRRLRIVARRVHAIAQL